jgi:Transposase DDE domain
MSVKRRERNSATYPITLLGRLPLLRAMAALKRKRRENTVHPSPAPDLPDTIGLTTVDVQEVSSSHDGKPIHWRLLTTRVLTSPDQARRIVDLYRKRWTIEEYFRTLKTAGFDIEAADIGEPKVTKETVKTIARGMPGDFRCD